MFFLTCSINNCFQLSIKHTYTNTHMCTHTHNTQTQICVLSFGLKLIKPTPARPVGQRLQNESITCKTLESIHKANAVLSLSLALNLSWRMDNNLDKTFICFIFLRVFFRLFLQRFDLARDYIGMDDPSFFLLWLFSSLFSIRTLVLNSQIPCECVLLEARYDCFICD